jgi:site-specific DNA recombinase
MFRSAAIYCRISRDRVGAGLGVDRQEQECRELAERLGWPVTVVHTDNDISAYSGKRRPGYRALLDDLRAGRVDAVLAWHNDRLHRSSAELEEYIEVCGAAPTHFVKAGPLDLSTASGRMTARITGAVARHEVEHMVERQKAAKIQAAQAGKFRGGRRPFGYERDGITVRPDEAARVLDATQRVLLGDSLGSIAKEWNTQGVTSSMGAQWTSVSVRDVLIRYRNAGLIEHEGKPIATAQWPAIVPLEQWQAVREKLTAPGRRRPRSNDARWLGSGLYRCGLCDDGTTMRSATLVGSNRNRQRIAYRCKNGPHVARAAGPVDGMVTELVLRRLSQPDARLLLTAQPDVDIAALTAESEALRTRNAGLVSMFGDGIITRGELEAERTRIEDKLSQIAAQLAAVAVDSPLVGFADADDVQAAWEAASVLKRKAVVDTLMVVTLLPAPRGRRPGGGYFDPTSIRVEWRQEF